MGESKVIKCPNCGFENIRGTRKCSKCRSHIDKTKKVCPKCGKINPFNVKLCTSCKFDFTKKKKSIWFNLIISLLLVAVLSLLVFIGQEGIVEKFNMVLSILAGVAIVIIFYNLFNLGKKDIINYSAEEEMFDDRKAFGIMKNWSNYAIVVGAICIIILAIYWIFVK